MLELRIFCNHFGISFVGCVCTLAEEGNKYRNVGTVLDFVLLRSFLLHGALHFGYPKQADVSDSSGLVGLSLI
jgi:hypothetical protein